MIRHSRAWRAAALLALLALAACSHGGRPRPAGPDGVGECPEPPGKAEPGSHFLFALTDDVSAEHAPVPTNPSEAVLFALLYETLVETDCAGRLVPGLARSWESAEGDRVWTFRLREDAWLARLGSSGKRAADAEAVREAWRSTRRNLRRSGELPWSWQGVPLRTVTAEDPERIRITCERPCPDLPALLSLPEFAVALREADDPDGAWPAGTRGIVADPDSAGERELVWWTESKDRATLPARITFRVRPGADPRDLAATDADAFLVRDARSEEYLRDADDLRVTPLPHDVTYWALTSDGRVPPLLTIDLAEDLAARVVAEPARPAPAGGSLAFGSPPGSPSPGARRIEFTAGDAAARSIAERLSVVAGSTLLAPGEEASPYPDAPLPTGEAGPGVTRVLAARPLPARSFREARLLGAAPWLAQGGWAIPLVEVRPALVTRAGLAGIRAGHDGTPRLDRAGWERGKKP